MKQEYKLSQEELTQLRGTNSDRVIVMNFWEATGKTHGFVPESADMSPKGLPYFIAEPVMADVVEIRPIQKDLLNIQNISLWTGMVLSDDESEKLCAERMELLYQQRDKLKADRDSVVKPLQLAIKRVDDMVNPILNPLRSAYEVLNAKLGLYLGEKRRRLEAEKQEAQRVEAARIKAQAEHEKKTAVATENIAMFEKAEQKEKAAKKLELAPVEEKQKSKTESGSAFVPVTHWYARVIDATLVPREFLIVDESALGKYATAMKDKAKVAGVEFYFEETTARRKR